MVNIVALDIFLTSLVLLHQSVMNNMNTVPSVNVQGTLVYTHIRSLQL